MMQVAKSGSSDNLLEQRHKLPAKLLMLTVIFVMIAELLVFIPSVAKFRRDWLQERIERAHLIALSLEVASQDHLTDDKLKAIFMSAEIFGVSRETGSYSQMILAPDIPPADVLPFVDIDLRQPGWPDLIADALGNMFSKDNLYLRVTGYPGEMKNVTMELFIEKAPLHNALWAYARGILWLSLIIGLFVATGVYAALYIIFVRPMMRLTENMAAFQAAPHDASRLSHPSGRRDEIGKAEEVLASMQREIRTALNQKTRLAALGEGMSKINHDLRNILSSASLMSDRLSSSDDPMVQKLSPRLISALDRAVELCRATLDYGNLKAGRREEVLLADLAGEAGETVSAICCDAVRVAFVNDIPTDLAVFADRTQLFRALNNLIRNAAEVLVENRTPDAAVTLTARYHGGQVEIRVTDNGPGVPQEAQAHLFTPFQGSVRQGGSGLGLAIASEVVRVHGGKLSLEKTGQTGTVFLIELPG